jgi:hypothetical protein
MNKTLPARNEFSAVDSINESSGPHILSPHRSCGTDQNLPAKVVAAVAVDGMFVCLDRIVMSRVWQMLPQGGFGNAAAITVMDSLHEQDQSEERCMVASFSHDVADTLLTGQHSCMHYMPEVLVVTRRNDGPLQTSFRVPNEMKLVVVRSILRCNTSYVSAEMVKSAVGPGEDFVGAALLGILVTACIVVEQDLAHNAVIPGRLKIVAHRTLLGVADWAGCACSRFGSNKFEEQRWVTQCNLGHAAAGGSACPSFHEPHDRDAVTPWCHEAGVNLLQYGERFTEPATSEFDATTAAVDHETNGSVKDRLEGSGHRGGTRTVTLQVHSIADTLTAGLVASTASLACCAEDSRHLPCGGFLRHPSDTKSAPLLDDICTVRRWGLDTGDLKVPFLPAQTVALSVVKSLSPELSRLVALPSCAPPSPALVAVMVLSHRALLTHACIRSAGYTATWDAQFRLGGTLELAPQIAPHTYMVVNRVSPVTPTLHMAVACRIGRDVRTVGIVNKSVGALAVLNHEGTFSFACSHRLSDHRSGIYVVTFQVDTVDNALWVTQNEHFPRAGSLRRIFDKLALVSNIAFGVQWRLDRYTSDFSLIGIPRLAASQPAACVGHVTTRHPERSHPASQPCLAGCLCRDACAPGCTVSLMNRLERPTHEPHYPNARRIVTRDLVGGSAGVNTPGPAAVDPQYALRSGAVAGTSVSGDVPILQQPARVFTPRWCSVASVGVARLHLAVYLAAFARNFLLTLASSLAIAFKCVRVLRRDPAGGTPSARCGFVKLVLCLWVLRGTPVVGAKGDVDLATWTKPGQGLDVWGATSGDNTAGRSVADAGDINKDGYHDILIGAYKVDAPGRADTGAAYLVFGSPSRSTSSIDTATALPPKGVRILGTAANDNWGWSVGGAGDFNKDGVDDFIIGGPYFDPPSRTDAGGAVVIFGKTSGWADVDLASFTSGSAGFWIWGAAAGDQLGISLRGAGDVNGDGAGDVVIGANGADPQSRSLAGASYVIFGHNTDTAFGTIDLSLLVSGSIGFRIIGATESDYSGDKVSGARDVNNDGYSDVIALQRHH